MVPFGVNCCPIEAEEKIWHHTHRSELKFLLGSLEANR